MRTTTFVAIVAALTACDGTSTTTAQRIEPAPEIAVEPAPTPVEAPEPEPAAEAIEEPPVADEPPVAPAPTVEQAPEPTPAPAPDQMEMRTTDPISEMDEPRGNAISEFGGQDNRVSEMDDDENPDRISDMSESKKN